MLWFLRGDTSPKLSADDQFPGELCGAWTTVFGRLDQASKFAGQSIVLVFLVN